MDINVLEKSQDVFLDKINQICGKFGLNNIMAQLYAILYFANKPLSLDEMVSRLKISKGSVSINIRALEAYGAVRKVWVKGSRKDYYEAETDISKVIMDRIKSMTEKRLVELDDMISSSYKALDSVDPGAAEDEAVKVFRKRLDELKAVFNQAQVMFELFKSSLLTDEGSRDQVYSEGKV